MMKNISIIVAFGTNYEIGKGNRLLWHIPDDLKRFKKLTTGHTIVMGKKTYQSLPNGALPDRRNIVISDNTNDRFQGCETAYSIENAMEMMDNDSENFVIGGGMIYKQFLKHAHRLYITRVNHSFEADTYFPEIYYDEWNEIFRQACSQEKPIPLDFTYLILEKKEF